MILINSNQNVNIMKLLITHTDKNTQKNFDSFPKNMICFSHLRWDFVFQRPQHLLTRLSESLKVFFIEEPIYDAAGKDYYTYLSRGENIVVMVPHIKSGLTANENRAALKRLFDKFMENKNLADHVFWYYTPMALEFSRKYNPELTVFDCMDELSAFKFAPEELKTLEKELLKKADIVFTGGYSIYEAKKNQHANIYPFPSSIEKEHFAKARGLEKKENGKIKLGFYGVIDERFDIDLIKGIADARPEWEIILIGPVVKIDPVTLPKNKNIYYLGSKTYQELPEQLATWDIALIPFLLNESTRFISPTKTPEYLAAAKPVISTPIRDVVNPYGKNKLVHIGSNASDFIEAAEKELRNRQKDKWLNQVDAFLALNSWDKTSNQMLDLMKDTVKGKSYTSIAQ
ncbi:MAG: glycosyl transferase [Mucilaginibacter sp.]|nr:glycosyl transferase [Mucilaginibacter sp.]